MNVLAELLHQTISSEAVKQFMSVFVYPAVGGAAIWAWSNVRKLTAIHQAIMGSGGMTLPDRVTSIENDLIVLRDGQRVRADLDSCDPSFECDAAGSCVYASRTLGELFGMPTHDMLGNGWLEAMDGATERSRVSNNWRFSMNQNTPWLETYRVHNRKTGERFLAEAHTFVSRNRDGKILRMFGVVERVEPVSKIEESSDNDSTPHSL